MWSVAGAVAAGVAWTVAWVLIDRRYGGLIETDFSTAGLQQAYSATLYFVGWAAIFATWGLVHVTRRLVRSSKMSIEGPQVLGWAAVAIAFLFVAAVFSFLIVVLWGADIANPS